MEFVKKNIGALIMLIVYVVVLVTFVNGIDARTDENEKTIMRLENASENLRYEKLVDNFVTRKEYETQLSDVKSDLNEIKSDIKKLLQRSSK